MAEQRKQQDRNDDVARSDADPTDLTRDAQGLPGGGAGADRHRGRRRPEASEADEALTEAFEEAKAGKKPAQQTGDRGQGPEDSEAAGE